MNTFEKMKNALESEENREANRNRKYATFGGFCKYFGFDADTEEITDEQFFELLSIHERINNELLEEHINSVN